jgi:hypothetical protein
MTRVTGVVTLHLHLSHLADALIQSDLQIGAFTLVLPEWNRMPLGRCNGLWESPGRDTSSMFY